MNKNDYQAALKHFQKGAVNCNNEYASLFAATLYYTGFNQPKRNPLKALDLFRKIASKYDNPVAQFFVGAIHQEGDEGIPQDNKYSFHWLLLSANNNWSYAMAYIGYYYKHGMTVEQDLHKALEWFKKVAEKDDNKLGVIDDGKIYLFGNKKFELDLTRANKEVDTKALFKIKNDLFSPVDCIINTKFLPDCPEVRSTVFWNLMTNKKSDAVAICQRFISNIYLGLQQDIPRNINKAIYWTRMGAKNGSSTCFTNIGLAYENGEGLKQDYKEALAWYKQSFALGGDIGFKIGCLYYKGNGNIKKDWNQALIYFNNVTLPSECMKSFFYMGTIYELGSNNIKDYKKAYDFYLKSYELGFPGGATYIAMLYTRGLGVKQDEEKAMEWLRIARSNGCPMAELSLCTVTMKGFKDGMYLMIRSRDIAQHYVHF